MRVGIDLRVDRSGIGRYAARLVEELVGLGDGIEYVLFARSDTYRRLAALPGVERRLADIDWYSVREQVVLPRILRAARVDLVHFTHFNVPLAFRGPYVVTIHDLTHLVRARLDDPQDPARRWWRALPYRAVLSRAARRAELVIAVSEATKAAIVTTLDLDPARVRVVYEGADSRFLDEPDASALRRLGIEGAYFLAVGNAYPHKNLPRLLAGYARARALGLEHELVLAGDHGRFAGPLQALRRELGLGDAVRCTGPVTDGELAALYRGATALVFVSLSEGFGLPGLEAMMLGVPVVASRIEALTEVYGDAALFVDPLDVGAIARALERVAGDAGLRERLRERGRARSARFSWRETALATRRIYVDCGA